MDLFSAAYTNQYDEKVFLFSIANMSEIGSRMSCSQDEVGEPVSTYLMVFSQYLLVSVKVVT